eukprot:GHRQ01035036.1.p1 GENE.GHRQ01035036.1~~GHRQ01035036.1.p1  ORF type:complete len:256 (+),score=123.77 GHRQ01035036.1:160-927(+)
MEGGAPGGCSAQTSSMAQLESLTRLAKIFTDPSCDIEARKKATDAIKDSQELWHTKEYRRFLEVFFEPLVSQLTSTPPQFEDSELHKLRHSVLEVLSKLPPNDVLRPYMPRLLALCLELLRSDSQANGVLAMRVLLDLNKNLVRSQAAGFEGQFNECVAFIEKVYAEFPATYSEAFSSSPPRLPSDFSPTYRSLKMVAECPLPCEQCGRLISIISSSGGGNSSSSSNGASSSSKRASILCSGRIEVVTFALLHRL